MMAVINGTNSDDVLRGTNSTDFLLAGRGNDSIVGGKIEEVVRGAEDNYVIYVSLPQPVVVDLAAGTTDKGEFGTDTLVGVNGVFGSLHDDVLTGGAFFRYEYFNGSGGNDVINGGPGFDVASYEADPGRIVADFGAGTVADGYGGTDKLSGVEAAIGSEYGDRMVGGGSHDEFYGRGGDDILVGGGGDDTLEGGDGDDVLVGGSGVDLFFYTVIEESIQNGLIRLTGNDEIEDFRPGEDLLAIHIEGGAAAVGSQLLSFDILDSNRSGVLDDGDDGVRILQPSTDARSATVIDMAELFEHRAGDEGMLTIWNQTALNADNFLGGFSHDQVVAELGRIENLTHAPRTIQLDHDFVNPVVIAGPLSFDGAQPAAVRITGVRSDSFTVQVQEPNHLDGGHIGEDLSFLVVEAGSWELPDGTLIEAGTLRTSKLTPQGFERVGFEAGFDAAPVVLSQVQSKNGADWVVTRQQDLTADGFRVAMQEEQALNGGRHAVEEIGWLAIERGTGSWDGHDFQAGSTGDRVTHRGAALEFADLIDETPQLLASIASFDGADVATLRQRGLGPDGVELRVQEEQSADAEVEHGTEAVGFLAIEGTGTLVAEPAGEVFVA